MWLTIRRKTGENGRRFLEILTPFTLKWGMGKGRFIMEMAARHPENNYIGIEMYDSVLLRALQKMEELQEKPANLLFIRMDARTLPEVFEKGRGGADLSELFRSVAERPARQTAPDFPAVSGAV